MSGAVEGVVLSGGDRARARRAAKDASGELYVDHSIFVGIEACLTRNGKTVAHVVKYADAVEIAAKCANPSSCLSVEDELKAIVSREQGENFALDDHPAMEAAKAAYQLGLAASRTTPPARSYADGVEDAAKVALKHGGMLAMAQGHDDAEGQADRWYEGGKHSAQVIAAAIRLLSQEGKA